MPKRVLIVGFGIEGRALADYFLDLGDTVTIGDKQDLAMLDPEQVKIYSDQGVKWLNGESYLDTLVDFDLIAFSPGIKYPTYQKIMDSGVEWTTQLKLFFKNTPTKNIIGVTGTKGKGTTSTLIYEMLKLAGKSVYLAGNIGSGALPLLKTLKSDDWVILELSSYQLRDLTQSPHIAVILNITIDHMDVHPDFEDYISSKANIIRFQNSTDFALLNGEYEVTKDLAKETKAQVRFFTKEDFRQTGLSLKIPGEHNFENAAAVLQVAKILQINLEVVKQVFGEFEGLPHRLELVTEVEGVKVIDDSFATSPSPTIVGIKSFSEPKILILGGSGKISDYSQLAQEIKAEGTVKAVIAIGQSSPNIVAALTQVGYDQVITGLENIDQVAEKAFELAEPGDVILLSPSDASFDWFKNYADRGEKFKEAVLKYVRDD